MMPIYSTVMIMSPTAAWQEILGESVKQILKAILNKQLVDCNKNAEICNAGGRKFFQHIVASVCIFPLLGIVRQKLGSWMLATSAGAPSCTSNVDAVYKGSINV